VIPVYVASKGRPDSATLRQLAADELAAFVFVEPQDADSYEERWDGRHVIVPLDQDDEGLAYVRQAILNEARALRLRWFWMLDDDITRFVRFDKQRSARRVRARDALALAEDAFRREPVAQAAIEYAQFAWSAEGRVRRNSYCDVAVALRADVPIDFRPETGVKCDRDYTLQLLAAGYDTLRTSAVAFVAPKNASNRGGLHDVYAAGQERRDSERMVELWGRAICELHEKPDGRPDVRINWRRFRRAAV
jgi:hypothetical protein